MLEDFCICWWCHNEALDENNELYAFRKCQCDPEALLQQCDVCLDNSTFDEIVFL